MPHNLNDAQIEFCKSMQRLFWWEKPEALLADPGRTLAGVMDRGDIKDWRCMERLFPASLIIETLETAKCGEFHKWSWIFWRARYGLDYNIPLPSRLPGWEPPSGDYWYKELQSPSEPADYDDPFVRLGWLLKLRDGC